MSEIGATGAKAKAAPASSKPEEKTVWARDVLRGAMAMYRVGYKELARRLKLHHEVELSAKGLAKKIARGGFSAEFMFQCLRVIGAQTLLVPPKGPTLKPRKKPAASAAK